MVSIAALDEALTIITESVDDEQLRPRPAAIGAARHAVSDLLAVIGSTFHEPSSETPPPPHLDRLRQAGLPMTTTTGSPHVSTGSPNTAGDC